MIQFLSFNQRAKIYSFLEFKDLLQLLYLDYKFNLDIITYIKNYNKLISIPQFQSDLFSNNFKNFFQQLKALKVYDVYPQTLHGIKQFFSQIPISVTYLFLATTSNLASNIGFYECITKMIPQLQKFKIRITYYNQKQASLQENLTVEHIYNFFYKKMNNLTKIVVQTNKYYSINSLTPEQTINNILFYALFYKNSNEDKTNQLNIQTAKFDNIILNPFLFITRGNNLNVNKQLLSLELKCYEQSTYHISLLFKKKFRYLESMRKLFLFFNLGQDHNQRNQPSQMNPSIIIQVINQSQYKLKIFKMKSFKILFTISKIQISLFLTSINFFNLFQRYTIFYEIHFFQLDEFITHLPNLEVLGLASLKFEQTQIYAPLDQLLNIKQLKLDFTNLDDLCLSFLERQAPQLIQLSIRGCKKLTKLALNYFFQKTCNLRQLDIRGIDNVGKSTFRVITEHVQKLEDLYLDVIYFKQMLLINRLINLLSKYQNSLQKLHIGQLDKINSDFTFDVFEQIYQKNIILKNLKKISISKNLTFSLKSFDYILKIFPYATNVIYKDSFIFSFTDAVEIILKKQVALKIYFLLVTLSLLKLKQSDQPRLLELVGELKKQMKSITNISCSLTAESWAKLSSIKTSNIIRKKIIFYETNEHCYQII